MTPSDPAQSDELRARLARTLGPHYEVRRRVDRHEPSAVFEVYDARLDRRLAFQVLPPGVTLAEPEAVRFREAAARLARIAHPAVTPVLFVGEGDGLVYLARPWVDGESLDGVLRRGGPVAPDRAVELMLPVLDGLAAMHALGLVHGGITPGVIFLDAAGRPVLDGVAGGLLLDLLPPEQRARAGAAGLYLAPEQRFGAGAADPRADVYAAAAVLFQLVTATLPFEGQPLPDLGVSHADEPEPVRAARDRRLPRWLAELLGTALARERAERPASAAALRDALRAGPADSAAAEPVGAAPVARRLWGVEPTVLVPPGTEPPAAPADPPGSSRRRAPRWPWIVGALLLVAGAGWAALELTRPRLRLINPLAAPVELLVADRRRVVPAGDTLDLRLGRGGPLVARWTLVPPPGPDGAPLGETFGDTLRIARSGRVEWRTSSQAGGTDYFAPLVSNADSVPLVVAVNAGLVGARDCRCAVRPGARRAFVGYYRLYGNSTVEARRPDGATATFRDLGSFVTARGGTVGLRFESRDFR